MDYNETMYDVESVWSMASSLDNFWNDSNSLGLEESFSSLEEIDLPGTDYMANMPSQSTDAPHVQMLTPCQSATTENHDNLPDSFAIPSPEFDFKTEPTPNYEHQAQPVKQEHAEVRYQYPMPSYTAPASSQSQPLAQEFSQEQVQQAQQRPRSHLPLLPWPKLSRRTSIAKMPLSQLYQIMGLPNDHNRARAREERIMSLLKDCGFETGQRTWIRDTEEPFRRQTIDKIYHITKSEYGYSKPVLEAIVRRGTYSQMQSNLRRKRRHKDRMRKRGGVMDF